MSKGKALLIVLAVLGGLSVAVVNALTGVNPPQKVHAIDYGESGLSGIPSDSEIRDYMLNKCGSLCFYDTLYIGNGNNNQTITTTTRGGTKAETSVTWRVWIGLGRDINTYTGALDVRIYEVTAGSVSSASKVKVGGNRLASGHPTTVRYDTTGPYAKTLSGAARLLNNKVYEIELNTSGWAEGSTHYVCTFFTSRSGDPGGYIEPSANSCAKVTVAYPPAQWSITPSTAASRTTAAPGDTITFTHKVKNNGPDTTTKTINYGRTSTANNFTATNIGNGSTKSSTSTYSVTQSDVGNSICRRTYAKPRSWNNTGTISSSDVCVSVPYDYSLTPQVSLDPSNILEPGGSVKVEPSVDNAGPTKSKNSKWQLSKMILDPGQAIPNKGYSGGGGAGTVTNPCDFYEGQSARDCDVFKTNDGAGLNVVFNPNLTTLGPYTYSNTDDLPAGTKLCFALSVAPNSHSDNRWLNSKPICLTIGKQPKVQVWGGDVRSQRNILTSTSTIGSKRFGSWGEYGVLAQSANNNMASAGALLRGSSAAGGSQMHRLTFANTSATGGPISGQFGTLSHIPLRDQFLASGSVLELADRGTISSSSWNVASKASGVYEAEGNLTIKGNLSSGQSIVIRPVRASDGTFKDLNITIEGNIGSSGTTSSLSQIPQLVLVAKDINIKQDVTRVDGWLLATGDINTCSDLSGGLTINKCNKRLTVNGPVEANKINLKRSAGSGTGSDTARSAPAEVFNLRADSSLWMQRQTSTSGIPTTVHVRELPPRF